MTIKLLPATLLLFGLLGNPPVFGAPLFPEPNWDRGMAMEVVNATDTQSTLADWLRLARAGESAALLESITDIRATEELPSPAVDYLVFSFTVGLSDLDANSVDSQVLLALSKYEPRTLVAHDDNARVGIPLFNIRAAAAGVRHAWERQKGGLQALQIDRDDHALWIERYQDASPAARRGFVDSLETAPENQARALGWAAVEALAQSPGLTVAAATAGIRADDADLVWQAIRLGDAGDLPAVLQMASSHFDPGTCSELLGRSLQLESDTRKALAIAQLGPAAMSEPAAQDALFEALGSRDLGASAALVLSGSADPFIMERLEDMAEKQQGLARQRATLAISLRSQAAGSVQ